MDVDWDQKSFHNFTSSRWLFDEKKQLAERHVCFNMNQLVKVACESIGFDESMCDEVKKLPEGGYSKAFLIRLHNEMEIIAKIPNPNAGPTFFTTASEVATMIFVSFLPGSLLRGLC